MPMTSQLLDICCDSECIYEVSFDMIRCMSRTLFQWSDDTMYSPLVGRCHPFGNFYGQLWSRYRELSV